MYIINITIAILFITFIEPKICKLFSREVFHCTTAQCQVIWVYSVSVFVEFMY